MIAIHIRVWHLSFYLDLGGYRRWAIFRNSQKINLYGFRSKVGAYIGP